MKFLGIFGLVGILCTFAIIAYMFGMFAEKASDSISNAMPQKAGKVDDGSSVLPKPHGIELQMLNMKTSITAYRLSKGDIPKPKSGDSTANDVIRQLFISFHSMQEKSFYIAGSIYAKHLPDEKKGGEQTLSAGENSWAYVYGPQYADAYGSVPLLIEPTRPGENHYRQEDYGDGRGVMAVLTDGSIQNFQINEKGEPVLGGKNILSTEFHAWRGDTPTVLPPAQ